MIKLKPCPFCGGKATMNAINDGITDLFYVVCESCYALRKPAKTENEAADIWNARTPGWISINDRLPEDGESILIFVNNSRDEPIQYDVCYYDGDEAWLDSGYNFGSDVTHWIPLPEPPEMD